MRDSMDDGEVELSDHVSLPNPDSSSSFHDSASADSFLDEILKNTRTCTHTHTCNPPGPDATHTHTCYHTHTQVIASEEDNDRGHKGTPNSKAKRPSGNREAVRKYREKKKAHTAYLEEEVKKLRLSNQQLVRKLQGQAILEAEVLRLRSLLLDLRGKIDSELGSFPFQKQCNGTSIFRDGDCVVQPTIGSTGLQCQTDLTCIHAQGRSGSQVSTGGNSKLMAPLEGYCQPAILDCQANTNDVVITEGHSVDAIESLVSLASHAQ